MKHLLFSLRPKNWIKNLFLFMPLVFGQSLFVYPANLKTVVAFFLFSLAASVVYLTNDIIDIDRDKQHPSKHLRPIPSGKISVKQAQITALVLGSLLIIGSYLLNVYFGSVVVSYILFNLIYSKILKNVVIIDVFCIGGFFLLRIVAGTFIIQVPFSYWMIFLAVLLALFLGFIKRRQELVLYESKACLYREVLAHYTINFIDQMVTVITSTIVVAYTLYTVDARTVREFGTTNLIYSIPFVYYGIFRYLYIVYRQKRNGDPTFLLLSDRPLQVTIMLWAIICVCVIYFRI